MSSSSPTNYHFRYNNPRFDPTRYVWRPIQKPQQQPQPQPQSQPQSPPQRQPQSQPQPQPEPEPELQPQQEEQEEELDLINLMSYVVEMQNMELLQAAVMQRTTTTYATPNVVAAAFVGEIFSHLHRMRRMMSFLEKDDSFLTPWGWDSFAHQSGTANFSIRVDNYHRFQLGSFFYIEYPEYFLRPLFGFKWS